jgi:transcriptional regulator with XRE-family HTH domain
MIVDPLGQALIQARAYSGRSIRGQARAGGIDHSTLLRWEQGLSRPNALAWQGYLDSLDLPPQRVDELNRIYKLGDLEPHKHDVIELGWSGAVLRNFRDSIGFDQTQMAKAFGVSQSTLSKWESDKQLPSESHFFNLRSSLAGTSLLSPLESTFSFAASIEQMDEDACYESYTKFWQSCRHFDAPLGELWGIALTNRLNFLSKRSATAKKLLSWTYASRIDWLLVRGRDADMFQLTFEAAMACQGMEFDYTGGNIFSLPTRSIVTKRVHTKKDTALIERFSKLTSRNQYQARSPHTKLAEARTLFVQQNRRKAMELLHEVASQQWNIADDGQMGNLGDQLWQDNRKIEALQFLLRCKDFRAVAEYDGVGSECSDVTRLLIASYQYVALSMLGNIDLIQGYSTLRKYAVESNLEFAFETIEQHIKRLTGVNFPNNFHS